MDEIRIAESVDGVCSLDIPNILLDIWYKNREGRSYVDMVNEKITDGAIMLLDLPKTEHRLRTQSYRVARKVMAATRRGRVTIKSRTSRVTIYQGEVARPSEQLQTIDCIPAAMKI